MPELKTRAFGRALPISQHNFSAVQILNLSVNVRLIMPIRAIFDCSLKFYNATQDLNRRNLFANVGVDRRLDLA